MLQTSNIHLPLQVKVKATPGPLGTEVSNDVPPQGRSRTPGSHAPFPAAINPSRKYGGLCPPGNSPRSSPSLTTKLTTKIPNPMARDKIPRRRCQSGRAWLEEDGEDAALPFSAVVAFVGWTYY